MKKRSLLAILAAAIVITSVPDVQSVYAETEHIEVSASVEEGTEEEVSEDTRTESYGSWEYTVGTDNTVTITSYTGSEAVVEIPSKIDDKSVVAIGERAFKDKTTIVSVVIPEGVTSVGYVAFMNCTGLVKVSLPSTLQTMGEAAFKSCTSLREIELPGTLSNIPSEAFDQCSVLSKVTLPTNLASIGTRAFSYCSSLKEIKIPEETTSIGNNAFYRCSNLSKITIPDSVISIGSVAIESNTTIYATMDSYAHTYAHENSIPFTYIYAVNVSECTVTLSETGLVYDGVAKTPSVVVTYDGNTLTAGTDYTISYENNVNAGTAKVVITGMEYYTGTKEATYTIAAKPIANCSAAASPSEFVYNKGENRPSVSVTDADKRLTNGSDYRIVSYSSNIDAGTGTVTIEGIGNYTGQKNVSFSIYAKDIASCSISLDNYGYTYSGSAIEPAVTVKDGYETLVAGKDYTVTYANNISAGTGELTITGISNYTGTSKTTFTISPKDISSTSVQEIANQFYNGEDVEPAVIVKDGSKTLEINTDYTVSYTDNNQVGTATITITGKNNYTGTDKRNFRIVQNTTTANAKAAGYNSVKVTWNKITGVTGYKVYRSASKKGTYSLISTVKNADTTTYKDSSVKTGTTYYYKVNPYIGETDGKNSNVVSAKPSLSKVSISSTKKTAANTVTVKWKKVTGANGYEVYRATSKNGKYTKIGKTTKSGAISYKDSKTSSGKTYYYKVRAYRTVGKKKIYSSYSGVKNVTV